MNEHGIADQARDWLTGEGLLAIIAGLLDRELESRRLGMAGLRGGGHG